jgi:hypothetical protein
VRVAGTPGTLLIFDPAGVRRAGISPTLPGALFMPARLFPRSLAVAIRVGCVTAPIAFAQSGEAGKSAAGNPAKKQSRPSDRSTSEVYGSR